jgi:hypothetical protein
MKLFLKWVESIIMGVAFYLSLSNPKSDPITTMLTIIIEPHFPFVDIFEGILDTPLFDVGWPE